MRACVLALHAATLPDEPPEPPAPAEVRKLRRARSQAVVLFVALLVLPEALTTATINRAAAALYLAGLLPAALTQVHWWGRSRVARRRRPEWFSSRWHDARRLGAACLVAFGWYFQFGLVSVMLNIQPVQPPGHPLPVGFTFPHAAGIPADLAYAVARLSFGIVGAALIPFLVLALMWVTATGKASVAALRYGTSAGGGMLPVPPAGLAEARRMARGTRAVAVTALITVLATLGVIATLAVPFGEERTRSLVAPLIYMGSFVAWPVLVMTHYRWAHRALELRKLERELAHRTPLHRLGADLWRVATVLLVAYGWLLVFFLGPSATRYYLGVADLDQTDLYNQLLVAHTLLLVLFGPVALVAVFWRDRLAAWLRARLLPLGNTLEERFPRWSWKQLIARVGRITSALLALVLLPLYLEDWGLWNPPPAVMTILITVEGIALVATVLLGRRR